MEYFIEQVRLLLPVLGFDFLRARPRVPITDGIASADTSNQVAENPFFEIVSKKQGLEAQAREVDDEFVVLAGSTASARWTQDRTSRTGYAKLHAQLLQEGRLVTENDHLAKFVEDTAFSSPSAAAAVIYGRAANGRKSWRVRGRKITYAGWQEELAEALSQDDGAAEGA